MEETEMEFKKPTLIGKIGKLPRKLNAEEGNKNIKLETIKPQVEPLVDTESPPTVNNVSISKNENLSNPYKEPSWSKNPDVHDEKFNLEVIKSGVILETIELNSKSHWTFGRLPGCDIIMAHPTISRYHAVLQYNPVHNEDRAKGWYIYDQNSTHGTFLNKTKIMPLKYVFLKPGFIIKFGGSTRNYILIGNTNDYDENQMTITDVINKKKEFNDLLLKKKEELQKKKELEEDEGIDWGMGEDADQETDLTENPFAMTNNEELFLDDPKKTLRGFFEREGLELIYNVEDKGSAHFICRIELPVDNSNGQPIVAQYSHHGKKKEVVVQCALEACRILDRLGLLRQSNQEAKKRKPLKSDSEDDDFLDRTGDVERKRLKKSFQQNKKPSTHKDLLNEEKELLDKICVLKEKLSHANQKPSIANHSNDNDALDSFMLGLQEEKMDNITKRKIMFEINQLEESLREVQKLIKIAEPNKLPDLKPNETVTRNVEPTHKNKKKLLPLYGKRPCFKNYSAITKPETTSKAEYVQDEEIAKKDDLEITDSEDTNICLDKRIKENITENKIIENNDIAIPNKDEVIINSFSTENKIDETKQIHVSEKQKAENLKLEKQKIRRNRFRNRTKDERSEDNSEEIDQLGEKYNTWVPPVGQTGDGKTKLNEKFGY